MHNRNKVTSKYFFGFLFVTVFITLTVESKNKASEKNSFHNFLTAEDAVKPGKKKLVKEGMPPVILQKKNPDSTNIIDSIPERTNDSITKTTITKNVADSVVSDTIDLKFSKDSLDAPIEYNAEDSMILAVPTKKITLYGKKT